MNKLFFLKNNNIKKISEGFSLLELLLYLSISSIILLSTSLFLSTLLESRIKNQTIAEVDGQGMQVMQIITQTVRNATSVNSPTIGSNASSLSLNVVNAINSPTIFNLSSGIINITEGANASTPLTNSHVVVSNLSFSNLSRPGTSGIIRVQFDITQVNVSNRNEYSYTKTFIDSATLK